MLETADSQFYRLRLLLLQSCIIINKNLQIVGWSCVVFLTFMPSSTKKTFHNCTLSQGWWWPVPAAQTSIHGLPLCSELLVGSLILRGIDSCCGLKLTIHWMQWQVCSLRISFLKNVSSSLNKKCVFFIRVLIMAVISFTLIFWTTKVLVKNYCFNYKKIPLGLL